jgi:hypothetical protein
MLKFISKQREKDMLMGQPKVYVVQSHEIKV